MKVVWEDKMLQTKKLLQAARGDNNNINALSDCSFKHFSGCTNCLEAHTWNILADHSAEVCVLAKFKFPRVHSGFQTEPFTTASACSQFVVKHSLSNYIFFSVKFSFRELNEQNVD